MKKLLTNKNIGYKKPQSIISQSTILEKTNENMDLLNQCFIFWNSLRDFRDRRRRNLEYYYGNQWNDVIYDYQTKSFKTEKEIISQQGRTPLKQNVIRQVVKSLIGLYRTDKTKTNVLARSKEDAALSEMLSNTIQYGLQINSSQDLDPREFEEFLLSGAAVQRVGYKHWNNRDTNDVTVDNENINCMFFNSDIRDIRMNDLRLIGRFIDMVLDDVVTTFAKTKDDENLIREWYSGKSNYNPTLTDGLSSRSYESTDFYVPYDPMKCRVYEIWYLKYEWRVYCQDWLEGKYFFVTKDKLPDIEKRNAERVQLYKENGIDESEVPLIEYELKYEPFWFVKYLTPNGYTLLEEETPYEHKEHPFVLLLYPLVDGKVWGFVQDILDQQRYINRLMTMLDFIIGASAKGVLLVPDDAIPDDMDINDFSDEWSKFNGVIKYKAKPGVSVPTQISQNSTNIGINELLSVQMKLMNDISGVSPAVMGQDPKSGTPASLYAQTAQNSTVNSRDYMESFAFFRRKRDWKVLKTQIQFYNEKRYLAIAGNGYLQESKWYDPDKVQDVDFDLVLSQSADSPMYRALIDNTLYQLLSGGFIDIEMFLENTSIPFAENLLAQIKKRQEDAAQQQQEAEAAQAGQSAAPGTVIAPNRVSQAQANINGVGQDIANGLRLQGAKPEEANQQGVDLLNQYLGMNNNDKKIA